MEWNRMNGMNRMDWNDGKGMEWNGIVMEWNGSD